VSYALTVAAAAPPSWRALRDAIALPDLRVVGDEPATDAWPANGLGLCRAGKSTRTTEVDWKEKEGKLEVVIRALASPDDCDLALRVTEAAARLAGAAIVDAYYFGDVDVGELRRYHTAEWMREQADSATRAMATLIRDKGGPLAMPGPNRSCYIGARLLAELEAAGPPEALSDRVLETLRRVQWDVPAGFRDAGVFVSGGPDNGHKRETHFAVWLPDQNLVIPLVDYVALRVAEGEVFMVPFAAVAELAGPFGTLLDECQLLVRAVGGDDWTALIARARPLATSSRK
jgi:hypothetical protein